MKSKASYFSISKPLIIENIRRLWAIPVLAFLVYFLSGVFPLLMSYNHLNNMASYIELSLNNQQPFYMFAHLMFPIVTAVIIYKYLQGISSVSVMHSMPFTRAKLYNSNFISGLILIISPILLNGIILLAISKPVYYEYGVNGSITANAINIFARANILNWIWVSIIIAVVVFAVSVFAGIITGNSLMHFASAAWFNFLIPALYAIFIAYFSFFIYGFDSRGNWIDFGMTISPFLNAIQDGGKFGIGVTIYYILTFLVLFVVTSFLYQKRKLEHATDSLAFSFIEPIICYLIAFLGMTAIGFYFQVLGESDFYMYAGLAAGTLIFFILGQMIVKKTPRIFNIRSLKSLGIYTLIAIIFILCLEFDVTGFERRVPNINNIKNFKLNEDFSSSYNPYKQYMQYMNYSKDDDLEYKDPENIKAITALHKSFIENKARFEEVPNNLYNSSVHIEYDTGSAFLINRRYNMDYNYFKNSKEFKQIYESKEFKDFYSLNNLEYEKLSSIYINTEGRNMEAIEIVKQKDISDFMACLDKDFKSQTYEDMVSLKHSYAIANINYSYKNLKSDKPKLLEGNISYKITHGYTNTINWLEEHGYTDRLTVTADQVEYIELFHYEREEPIGPYVEDTKWINVEENSLKITDPKEIQTILDTYETQNINYNNYYYGTIVYKVSQEIPDYIMDPYDPYAREEYDKYHTDNFYSTSIYLNEGNIPSYVLEYFKK